MNDKKKILIIEDEPSLQKSLMDYLELEGFETQGALDGERGVELAKNEKPDLILLDIILPKKDGYEVLDDLKKYEKTKNIPIILLTNLESQEDILKGIEKGAVSYLVKSDYRLEEVVNKIREALKI